jgi:hypothetical protein
VMSCPLVALAARIPLRKASRCSSMVIVPPLVAAAAERLGLQPRGTEARFARHRAPSC